MANKAVKLRVQDPYVYLENGILKLTLSKPDGALTGIQYGGMDNLLDTKLNQSIRGYWDINWNLPGGNDIYQRLEGSEFSVVHSSEEIAEVSFRSNWDSSSGRTRLPLIVDKRIILRSGVSGFHCYAIYERDSGWPAFDLVQTRMVFKLRRDRFHYMAITDKKQRIMPMPEDRLHGRCIELAYPEAVLLTNPINPALKGEVDDKYQYSMDNKDGGVHGWISSGPFVGFWVIFPSNEFRNGGPTKQNLTCHTGPVCLAMFHGTHYIGEDIVAKFEDGEPWRKVVGPFFVYLNLTSSVSNAYSLWEDAKKQRIIEETTWPYDFISSPYFLTAQERGSAAGRLFVQDRFVSRAPIPAKYAYIGLAAPGEPGSWQTESKGYQFWAQTDSNGEFTINNVCPGVYNINAWVPGFIGDYLHAGVVTISSGSQTKLGNLIYAPPRYGPTLWEIGFPDRTAIGFYVPDPNPLYINKLFVNSTEKFRQYGLWDRYTDIHPDTDQIFMIGVNDPKKDWFFAHVDRRRADKTYQPSTWQIKFNLTTVVAGGVYKLHLSIASATHSNLQVRVNDLNESPLLFQTSDLGTDNTIARHGIHGLYRLFSVDVNSSLLVAGDNTIFLVQAKGGDKFFGILYDYIRLEGPQTSQNSSG